jgi:hypothetical protein
MARWKIDPPHNVCAALDAARQDSADGKVSFRGMEYLVYVEILAGLIDWGTIPSFVVPGLVRRTLNLSAGKGRIDAASILEAAEEAKREFFSKPVAQYSLLAQISVPPGTFTEPVDLDGVLIDPFATPTKEEKEGLQKFFEQTEELKRWDFPRSYGHVRVVVHARSEREAGESALDSLDLVRCSWNLFCNREVPLRWSGGSMARPANPITLGPIHVLTDKGGSVSRQWWYDPHYRTPVIWSAARERAAQAEVFRKSFFTHLARSHYKSDLAEIAIRYVRALDLRDWSNSFLRLWGILEALTATMGDSHKATVRRAGSFYADHDLAMQELTVLRMARNEQAHVGHEPQNPEHFMYRLKGVVEDLMEFHLGNSLGFEGLAEAGAFLDQPFSIEVLKRKIQLVEYAIGMRERQAKNRVAGGPPPDAGASG